MTADEEVHGKQSLQELIAERLVQLRGDMAKSTLAHRSGIQIRQMEQIESGRSGLSESRLHQLAVGLGLPVETLRAELDPIALISEDEEKLLDRMDLIPGAAVIALPLSTLAPAEITVGYSLVGKGLLWHRHDHDGQNFYLSPAGVELKHYLAANANKLPERRD